MPRTRHRRTVLLVLLGAAAFALAGCAADPEVVESAPSASPTPTEAPAPTSVRPDARIALTCDQLVPTAAADGFGAPALHGVVDLDSAAPAQAGWTWCSWGAVGQLRLELVVVPDGPIDDSVNEPCVLFPSGAGCTAQVSVGSTQVWVTAGYPGGTPLADADQSFPHIVENVAAILAETTVAPAITPQRTVPAGAVSGLDPATAAGWFGVDPDGGIPLGVPQEILGDAAYRQTASETAAWGTEELSWVQVDLLPGGGWAAAGFPDAPVAPLQQPSAFEPTEVPGFADAALETSDGYQQLCGAIGTDLVCVAAYGVDPALFLQGAAALAAELG